MEYVIRPVGSLAELAAAFEVIGAQFPQRFRRADRRFADLARRFPADRPLMLVVVEDGARLVGGALAFRTSALGVTLRIVGLAPGARGRGLGRRLVEQIEAAAQALGVRTISLGADDAAGFYTGLGYSAAGGALHKALASAAPAEETPPRSPPT